MQKKIYELEKEFNSNVQCGLCSEQVSSNKETYGKNVLEEKKKTPLIIKFLLEFKDPLIIMSGSRYSILFIFDGKNTLAKIR